MIFCVAYWWVFILLDFDGASSKNDSGVFQKPRSKVDKMAEWTRKGIRDTFYVARGYAAQWIYIGPSQSESKTQQIDVIEGLAYSPVSFPQIAPSLSSTRSSNCYNREREWAQGVVHATWTVTASLRPSPDILNINDSTLKSSFSF
jgi:hypothetical protein